jgi:hypothetical protein
MELLSILDCPDSWKTQLANAGIMAGVTFFSSLASGAGPLKAGIAAGYSFFITLAIQRGLVKASEKG